MAELKGISETDRWIKRYGPSTMGTPYGDVKKPDILQDDKIHQSFPMMGVTQGAHQGSQSSSPNKDVGDYEENLPASFGGRIRASMSPL